MSGLRPFTTGVYENNNDWRTVVPEEQTLTHVFRQAGYFVCGAGKIYHESYPRRSDWDDYLQNEGKLGAEIGRIDGDQRQSRKRGPELDQHPFRHV